MKPSVRPACTSLPFVVWSALRYAASRDLTTGTLLVGGAFIAALAAARRVTRLSPLDALRAY
jgi:ABC-type lipoprotein release transport system permease subunit